MKSRATQTSMTPIKGSLLPWRLFKDESNCLLPPSADFVQVLNHPAQISDTIARLPQVEFNQHLDKLPTLRTPRGHQTTLTWRSARTRHNPRWSVQSRCRNHDAESDSIPGIKVYVEWREGPTSAQRCHHSPYLLFKKATASLLTTTEVFLSCQLLAKSWPAFCSTT